MKRTVIYPTRLWATCRDGLGGRRDNGAEALVSADDVKEAGAPNS